MHKGNVVHLSKEKLERRNWQIGQYININLLNEEGLVKLTAIAKIQCDAHLPTDLIYGNIYEWSIEITNCLVELIEANENEISMHQQKEHLREKQALADKKQILERCKKSDQTIPIRLVAGGLDDA